MCIFVYIHICFMIGELGMFELEQPASKNICIGALIGALIHQHCRSLLDVLDDWKAMVMNKR